MALEPVQLTWTLDLFSQENGSRRDQAADWPRDCEEEDDVRALEKSDKYQYLCKQVGSANWCVCESKWKLGEAEAGPNHYQVQTPEAGWPIWSWTANLSQSYLLHVSLEWWASLGAFGNSQGLERHLGSQWEVRGWNHARGEVVQARHAGCNTLIKTHSR